MSDKPAKRACTARTAGGRRCRRTAAPGSTRCDQHSFTVPGRPSKLTPELQEQLLYLILEGNYIEVACQAAGIDKTTYYRWIRRAEEAEAKAAEMLEDDELETNGAGAIYDHADPADWPYLDFRHAIKSAEAFAETEDLRKVDGRDGWQAFMARLERRHPQRWRRRDSRKLELEGGVDVRKSVTVVPPAERRAEIAGILDEAGALAGAAAASSSTTSKPKAKRTPPKKRGPKK